MLKKLLLTAALISTTFGAEIEYIDPDFSLLANRSDWLVVDENRVIINLDEAQPQILHRLTKSDVVNISSSTDFNALNDVWMNTPNDIWHIQAIYTALTADTALDYGISKAQDAALLSQLFWNRISLLEKTFRAMLLSPQIVMDDPSEIIKQQHEKLIAFSAKYDSNDTTPFIKGNQDKLKQLMDEFHATHGY